MHQQSGMIPVSIGIMMKGRDSIGVSFWMQTRSENGPLHGLWEFPGGKIEMGEGPLAALNREIREEVNIEVDQWEKKLFKIHPYSYRDRTICLYVYYLIHPEKDFIAAEKGQWFYLDYNLKSAHLQGKIPPVNHVIIDELLDYLKQNGGTDFFVETKHGNC